MMSKRNEKILFLDHYLKKNYQISLFSFLSEEEKEEIKQDIFSSSLLKKLEILFHIHPSFLLQDEKIIDEKTILFDTSFLSFFPSEKERKRKTIPLKKGWYFCNGKEKKKMILHLSSILIPLSFFIFYSFSYIIINVVNTLQNYEKGDQLSSSQQTIHNSLLHYQSNYVPIHIGAQLNEIRSISTTNQSFEVTMDLLFDFNQIEFHSMWWEKEKGISFFMEHAYKEEDLIFDQWSIDPIKNTWVKEKDQIPDILQFEFQSEISIEEQIPVGIVSFYEEARAAYPGEKSSNVFPHKNDEFSIGNGKLSPDSLEYVDAGTPYFDQETNAYRFTQKLHFSAVIYKVFDSPRYPLDSVQFHIYIKPTHSVDFIRYTPSDAMSGFSTYFSISQGYRLIKENGKIKQFSILPNYYVEKELDPSSIHFQRDVIYSQLEIIVRANKYGFAIYLSSFLNNLAIAGWSLLSFYHTSFYQENNLSMMETGFFLAISTVLFGFTLLSNTNTFSLFSILNIYTLILVLLISYESFKNNSPSLKLAMRQKVLFYTLSIFSFLIYILLPMLAYLWIL